MVMKATTNDVVSAKKLLYVDVANYSGSFFPYGRQWNLSQASNNVKRFCEAFQQDGWSLVVFIDESIVTEEAMCKWRKRREREVRKGERQVPQGCLRLVGDMFQENGIQVHYSIEADNDDTIASYAQQDGASVMSQDADFLRYRGATYTLYANFVLKGNRLKSLVRHKGKRKSGWRDLIVPAPATGVCNPFRDCLSQQTYIRGSPSPLVELGNLHIHVRSLRAALYQFLGVQGEIAEEFPVCDYSDGQRKCCWDKQCVAADDSCAELLLDPAAALKHYTESLARPACASDDDWYKHKFALRAIIAEICCTVLGETLLKTLRPLMTDVVIPKKKSHYVEWRDSQQTDESNQQKRERYLKLFPNQNKKTKKRNKRATMKTRSGVESNGDAKKITAIAMNKDEITTNESS